MGVRGGRTDARGKMGAARECSAPLGARRPAGWTLTMAGLGQTTQDSDWMSPRTSPSTKGAAAFAGRPGLVAGSAWASWRVAAAGPAAASRRSRATARMVMGRLQGRRVCAA